MKTAEQIAQEMEKHKSIDKTNVMYDETWEDYMRGNIKRKPCINYEDGCEEWAGCPCVYYKSKSEVEK